jgi:MGT family glycosyltransferase
MFRNEAELNLVYTSKEFQPAGDSFSSRFKFVGPSLAPDSAVTPLPFPLPTNIPVIYISLGTLFNENILFYRTCFDTFADMPIHVIMSIGAKVLVEQLGQIPRNFTVRQSVPQLAVLRRAQVFITHGGMNSVHEALFLGVPMVVIPQAADQHFVAQRVSAVGAGVRLNRKQLSQRTLRQAVERVIGNPAYHAASDAVGASLRSAGGYARAANEINEFKQSKQIA